MGLTIVPNKYAPTVATLLRRLCPDPELSILVGTVSVPDPDGGPSVTIALPGIVTYVPNASFSKTCTRLAALAGSTQTITIEMVDGTVLVDNRAMNTLAGITRDTPLHKGNKDWGRIEITLDGSDGDGGGYWAEDATGAHIDLTMDIVLAHELGHAEQFLTSSFGGLSEPLATDAENDYRAERGLTLRNRLSHAGERKVPVAAPATPKTSTAPSTSCFIVSAAHGSPLAPDVLMLRALRDNILRKTRTGARFYDWFYEHYYRFSPAVVSMMERDPAVRDMVRWIAVTPIVQYLDALVTFPTAALEDVPEPWRGYLTKMNAGFEEFASAIEAPLSFEGETPEDTVTELALLLRHRFRTEGTRQGYLQELQKRGALPLVVRDAAHRARLQEMLGTAGAGLGGDACILSSGDEASRFVAGVFGGTDAISGNPDFMYVFLTNTSAEVVDDVALAYKRTDMSISALRSQPMGPTSSVMFCLGRADKIRSFSFRGFEGTELVLELSGFDITDSFIQDHMFSPNTYEFFFDGKPIM